MKKYLIPLIAAAGLLVGCDQASVESASQDFNSLPPDVQKAVRAEAPNAEITGIERTTRDGMEVYEVELRQGETTSTLIVSATGRVLNSNTANEPAGAIEKILTPTGAAGTPLSALPVAVQKTVQKQAPDAQIANIARQEENGQVIYKVEFKDQGQNMTLRVAEDGTLVQELLK